MLRLDSSVTLSSSALRSSELLGVMSRFSLRLPAGQGFVPLPLHDATWPRRIGVVTRRGAYGWPLLTRFILLADLKKPRSVDFVAELPRNPNGKLSRNAVREPFWAGRDRRVG